MSIAIEPLSQPSINTAVAHNGHTDNSALLHGEPIAETVTGSDTTITPEQLAAPVLAKKITVWERLQSQIDELYALSKKNCFDSLGPKYISDINEAKLFLDLFTQLGAKFNKVTKYLFYRINEEEGPKKTQYIANLNHLLNMFNQLAFDMMTMTMTEKGTTIRKDLSFFDIQLDDKSISKEDIKQYINPEYIDTGVEASEEKAKGGEKKEKTSRSAAAGATWVFKRRLIDLQRNLLISIRDTLGLSRRLEILNPDVNEKFYFMFRPSSENLEPRLHTSVVSNKSFKSSPAQLIFKSFIDRLLVTSYSLFLAIKASYKEDTKTLDARRFIEVLESPKSVIAGHSKLTTFVEITVLKLKNEIQKFIKEKNLKPEIKQRMEEFVNEVGKLENSENKDATTANEGKVDIGINLTVDQVYDLAKDFKIVASSLIRTLMSKDDFKSEERGIREFADRCVTIFDYDDFVNSSHWSALQTDNEVKELHEKLGREGRRKASGTYRPAREHLSAPVEAKK